MMDSNMFVELDALTMIMEEEGQPLSWGVYSLPPSFSYFEKVEHVASMGATAQNMAKIDKESLAFDCHQCQELDFSQDDLVDIEPPKIRIIPTNLDVLFGKGGTMNHAGNKTFRAECQRLAPRFLQCPEPRTQDDVALELLDFVYNRGGRFLARDKDSEGWQIARFDKAFEKARQLLRDEKKNDVNHTSKERKRQRSQTADETPDSIPTVRKKRGAQKRFPKSSAASTKDLSTEEQQKIPQQRASFVDSIRSTGKHVAEKQNGSIRRLGTFETSPGQIWICGSTNAKLIEVSSPLDGSSIALAKHIASLTCQSITKSLPAGLDLVFVVESENVLEAM